MRDLSFLDELGDGNPSAALLPREELIVEKGHVRQAGTTDSSGSSISGEFVTLAKQYAEKNLYVFCKTILGLDRLTPHLHLEVCQRLQSCPPYRKLILLPRDCFKTTIVSKGMPLHMFIQQPETNPYLKGILGVNIKILLACETESRSKKHVQWIEAHLEKNQLLRAFWPQIAWESPRSDARAWNATEMFLPRTLAAEQSDPSLLGIGVGGAVTGGHFHVILLDDLVTFEAMNSVPVMQEAIEWQRLSRSMLEDLDTSLEFIVGTHWAVNDLYTQIRKNDPTVEVYKRSLVEDGKIIFPEEFSEKAVSELRNSYGYMFDLLYQNDPRNPSLCDFSEDMLRYYELIDGRYVYAEDHRDDTVDKWLDSDYPKPEKKRYSLPPLDESRDLLERGRKEYLGHSKWDKRGDGELSEW